MSLLKSINLGMNLKIKQGWPLLPFWPDFTSEWNKSTVVYCQLWSISVSHTKHIWVQCFIYIVGIIGVVRFPVFHVQGMTSCHVFRNLFHEEKLWPDSSEAGMLSVLSGQDKVRFLFTAPHTCLPICCVIFMAYINFKLYSSIFKCKSLYWPTMGKFTPCVLTQPFG